MRSSCCFEQGPLRYFVFATVFFGIFQLGFYGIAIAQSGQGDPALVKSLLADREMMAANDVYESSFYNDLLRHQKSHELKLINQEEIHALNIKLKQVRSDLEKQSSEKSKEKLKTKEAELVAQRAHLEVQDAATLSYYTQAEYFDVRLKAESQFSQLKEKAQERPMLINVCDNLFVLSDKNMSEAASAYTHGFEIQDDVNRSLNAKEAFAQEALAISQLDQVIALMQNLNALFEFSNEELIAFRGGLPEGTRTSDEAVAIAPVSEEGAAPVIEQTQEIKSDEVAATEAELLPEMVVNAATEAPVAMAQTTSSENVLNENAKPAEPKESIAVKVEKKMERTADHSNVCRVNDTEADLVFFTIQVGAFKSKPDNASLKSLGTICVDNSDAQMTRYVFGQFESLDAAKQELMKVKANGYSDAFITAYVHGTRVKVAEASHFLEKSTR